MKLTGEKTPGILYRYDSASVVYPACQARSFLTKMKPSYSLVSKLSCCPLRWPRTMSWTKWLRHNSYCGWKVQEDVLPLCCHAANMAKTRGKWTRFSSAVIILHFVEDANHSDIPPHCVLISYSFKTVKDVYSYSNIRAGHISLNLFWEVPPAVCVFTGSL